MKKSNSSLPPIALWVCSQCGNTEPTKTIICASCKSQEIEIKRSKGLGSVVASTIIRRPSAACLFEGPVCLCVVKLDEKVLVSGHFHESRLIETGTRVRAFETQNDVPIFTDTVKK